MTRLILLITPILLCGDIIAAEASPAKPQLKITPGKVIIPLDKMRRIWGELISIDMATRTGKFRNEGTDEVMSFTVMPYAELLHHATNGDLQDFRVGERAIFRMHENEKGEWVWLTYIQDEMNMMNGHKEFYHVDSIDAAKGLLTCTQASADKSYVREQGIQINTDKETKYWKGGMHAKFTDIKPGDQLRTRTHGVGKGKTRIAWDVFMDEESLLKFQAEQKIVQTARIKEEGAPGYVDEVNAQKLTLTLFNESGDLLKQLKAGTKVRVAPAGVNRKPSGAIQKGSIVSTKMVGRQNVAEITLDAPAAGFKLTELARLWTEEN